MKENPIKLSELWRLGEYSLPILKNYSSRLVLCVLLAFSLVIFELLRPQPIRILFDALLIPKPGVIPWPLATLQLIEWEPLSIIALVAVAILTISVGIALTNYGLEVTLAYLGNKYVARLRAATFRHLIQLPNLFHDTQKTGDLVVRLTGDIHMMRDLLIAFFVSVAARVSLLIGMVAIMFLMNPFLTAIVLVLMPLIFWRTLRTAMRVRALSRNQRAEESRVGQAIHETLGQMRTFSAYGHEDLSTLGFKEMSRKSFKNDVKSRRIRAKLSGVTEFTLAIGLCAVLCLGTHEVLQGRMSAGELLVFAAYLRTMFKPIRSLANLVGRTGKALACAERVMDILAEPITLEDAPDAVNAGEFLGRIELRNISLTYGGRANALTNVNLEIAPGEVIGVVGASGSGKSSLCMLIPRLYDPDEGSILIDGEDAHRYTIHSLREQISIVLQDADVFDLSVAENVAFGRETWTLEEVVEACEAAEIHDTIQQLPERYDTVIGERGLALSGGQRRRLTLARALMRKPRILILDEPFEGLDSVNARAIRETILKSADGRTVVIVSHHSEHLVGCDRIVTLSAGRLLEVPPEDQPAHTVEGSQSAYN